MISFSNSNGMINYGIALICGSFANIPFSLFFALSFPELMDFISKYPLAATFIFLVMALIFGFIFLEIAVVLESIYDSKLTKYYNSGKIFKSYEVTEKENPFLANWYSYLLKKVDDKKIVHGLIKYLVQRLVFLLSFISALVLFFVFLIIIYIKSCSINYYYMFMAVIFWFFLIKVIFKRAYTISSHLAYLRHLIVNN